MSQSVYIPVQIIISTGHGQLFGNLEINSEVEDLVEFLELVGQYLSVAVLEDMWKISTCQIVVRNGSQLNFLLDANRNGKIFFNPTSDDASLIKNMSWRAQHIKKRMDRNQMEPLETGVFKWIK